jgi:hypothetical protein
MRFLGAKAVHVPCRVTTHLDYHYKRAEEACWQPALPGSERVSRSAIARLSP